MSEDASRALLAIIFYLGMVLVFVLAQFLIFFSCVAIIKGYAIMKQRRRPRGKETRNYLATSIM